MSTTTTKNTSLLAKYNGAIAVGIDPATIRQMCQNGLAKGELVNDLIGDDPKVTAARAVIFGESEADSDIDGTSKTTKYGPPRMPYKAYSLPAIDVQARRKELLDLVVKGKMEPQEFGHQMELLGATAAAGRCGVQLGVGEAGWVMAKIPGSAARPANIRPELWRHLIELAKAGILDQFTAEASKHFKS